MSGITKSISDDLRIIIIYAEAALNHRSLEEKKITINILNAYVYDLDLRKYPTDLTLLQILIQTADKIDNIPDMNK